MSAVKKVAQAVLKKAIELAPDSWVPGGTPDPLIRQKHGLIGAPVSRRDGEFKVKGQATFAAEFTAEGMLYASLAYSTIPKGRLATLDTAAAEKALGVVGRVLIVDADQLHPVVFGKLGQKRRLVMARHAPRRPNVDDADLAFEVCRIKSWHLCAVAEQALQRR